jgi:hypothetical protein
MKTHFKKLRRIMLATAVAGPLLCFAAFVCLAMGYGWWSLIPLLLAGVFFLCVPILGIGRPEPASRGFLGFLSTLALIFALNSFFQLPEFNSFLDRVMSGEVLRNPSMFIAAALWTHVAVCRNWFTVSRLSDGAIFDHYSGKETGERA